MRSGPTVQAATIRVSMSAVTDHLGSSTTRSEPGAHVDSHQDGGEAQRSILGGKIGPQWDPRRGPRLGAGDGDAVPARDVFERGGHEANASNNMAKK